MVSVTIAEVRMLVRQIVRGEREDILHLRESSVTLRLPQLDRH